MMRVRIINSMSIVAFFLMVLFTPINQYANSLVYFGVILIWLYTANFLDSEFTKGYEDYFIFLLVIIILDSLLALSMGNMTLLYQSIAGKSIAYFSFVFFLFYRRNLSLLKWPLIFAFLSLLGTSFFTYKGNLMFPNASRILADVSNPYFSKCKSMLIGGYDFIYSLVLLVFPISLLVKTKGASIGIKIVMIFVLSFFCANILIASYFIGIILTVLSLLLALSSARNIFATFFVTLFLFFFLYIFKDSLLQFCIDFGNTIHSHMLIVRATQLLHNTYQQDSGEGSRLVIYMNAVWNFFDSPLYGKLLGEGFHRRAGHSGLLEYLSNYGILGSIYFFYFAKIFKTTFSSFLTSMFRRCYIMTFTLALIFFTVDIFEFSPCLCLIVFFISPCMLLLMEQNESTLVS